MITFFEDIFGRFIIRDFARTCVTVMLLGIVERIKVGIDLAVVRSARIIKVGHFS